MEAIEFIRQTPPFDQLPPESLLRVQQALDRLEVAEGARIIEQGGAPSTYLNIVRSGVVELRANGQVRQVLEPGDPFGYPSMLSHEPPVHDAVAVQPVVLYRLPESVFRELLAQPQFSRYFLSGLSERLRRAAAGGDLGGQSLALPVKHLVLKPPLFVAPTATVTTVAQLMTEHNVSSVLVEADPPGIVTDRDLRSRVLAAGLGAQTPVGEVMTRPLRTLDSDTPVQAALLTMLEQNIHHLALVEEGAVVGLITSTDLLRHQSQSPLYLRRVLESLDNRSDLSSYSQEVARSVEMLQRSGVAAAQIGRIVSSLNDTLIHRLVRMAEERLGPPPTPYAWIVFGSEGRLEQMLLTDQDNALVYGEASPEAETYFAALTQQVVDSLIQAGFPPCPGGYMATNWCMSLAAWQEQFTSWVWTPEPQALMAAGIFFDFRPVCGALSLEPLEQILVEANRNGIFMAHLARAAQSFAPPLGLFNRIRSEEGAVDLKLGGVAPIVALARALGLAAGSRERSTLERLAAAVNSHKLSREAGDDLSAAFQFFLQLRLRQQLEVLRGGGAPDNRIVLKRLAPRDQRLLKDAFVLVRQMQEIVASQLTGAL